MDPRYLPAAQLFDQLPSTQSAQHDGSDGYFTHTQFDETNYATSPAPLQGQYQLTADQPQDGQGYNNHYAVAYYGDGDGDGGVAKEEKKNNKDSGQPSKPPRNPSTPYRLANKGRRHRSQKV